MRIGSARLPGHAPIEQGHGGDGASSHGLERSGLGTGEKSVPGLRVWQRALRTLVAVHAFEPQSTFWDGLEKTKPCIPASNRKGRGTRVTLAIRPQARMESWKNAVPSKGL